MFRLTQVSLRGSQYSLESRMMGDGRHYCDVVQTFSTRCWKIDEKQAEPMAIQHVGSKNPA